MRKHLQIGALFTWILSTACGSRVDAGTDGATHWLKCIEDSECKSGSCTSGACEGEEAPRVTEPTVQEDAAPPKGMTFAIPNMGQSCIPGDEYIANFAGFSEAQVSIAPDTQCTTQVCLVNQFRGRVTCPYGQSSGANDTCTVAGGSEQVTVPVPAQLEERRPQDAVYCSCRCDGPDASAQYCACDPGFECKPLVPLAVAGREDVVGSYCVKQTPALSTDTVTHPCDSATGSCGSASDFTPQALGVAAPPISDIPRATQVSFELIVSDHDRCLSAPLPLADLSDSTRGIACRIFTTQSAEAAPPSGPARRPAVTETEATAVRTELERRSRCASPAECAVLQVCELKQLTAADFAGDYASCLNDANPTSNGWCYVDLDLGLGSAATVEECNPENLRRIRFTGDGDPATGSSVYMLCAGQQ